MRSDFSLNIDIEGRLGETQDIVLNSFTRLVHVGRHRGGTTSTHTKRAVYLPFLPASVMRRMRAEVLVAI